MKRKLSLKIPTVLSLLLLWMSCVIIGVQATGAPGLKELSWVVGGEEGSGGERIPAWQAGSLQVHAVCDTTKIPYFHCLWQNQCVEGCGPAEVRTCALHRRFLVFSGSST